MDKTRDNRTQHPRAQKSDAAPRNQAGSDKAIAQQTGKKAAPHRASKSKSN